MWSAAGKRVTARRGGSKTLLSIKLLNSSVNCYTYMKIWALPPTEAVLQAGIKLEFCHTACRVEKPYHILDLLHTVPQGTGKDVRGSGGRDLWKNCLRLTICRAQPSGSWDHGEGRAAVQGADVVHIWVDVGVWGAEGRLWRCSGVTVWGDPNEGQVWIRRATR